MEIGELTSKNLDKIINRLWDLERRFEPYCRQHDKVFESSIVLSPNQITLKCFIKNGNNGETKCS